jgi:hypothetical protein
MEAIKERGSELLRRLHGERQPIGPEHLENVYKAVDSLQSEVKLLRWIHKGTPVPDYVSAVFEVKRGGVGQMVDRLINDEKLSWNLEVFPYGIPYPDIAIIKAVGER